MSCRKSKTCCGVRVASYGVRGSRCELRGAGLALRVTGCGVRVTSFGIESIVLVVVLVLVNRFFIDDEGDASVICHLLSVYGVRLIIVFFPSCRTLIP